MKNHIFPTLLTIVSLAACTKIVHIPENGDAVPEKVPSNLETYSNDFQIYDLSYRTNPSNGDIYLESWDNVGKEKSYIPYIQLLGADGKLKWDGWKPLTDKICETYVNMTVADVTSDGCFLDCYNAFDGAGREVPFVAKMTKEGNVAWTVQLCDFGAKTPEYTPCEGFVVADNAGGAWVAAGNGTDSLVIRRVSADGVLSDPICFGNEGSRGQMAFVNRPQMIVNDSNELYALLQYSYIYDEGGSYEPIYSGYYDIVKISSDGRILSRNMIMPENLFSRGLRAIIRKDGQGGAYVTFARPMNNRIHAFVYHFNAAGTPDFDEVDILPQGCASGALKISTDVDPASGSLVAVMVNLKPSSADMLEQTVSLDGRKLVGQDGEPVVIKTTEGDTDIETSELKLLSLGDGKMNLSYIISRYMKAPVLCNAIVSTDGKMTDEKEITEIDKTVSGGSGIDNTDIIFNGNLRHIWFTYKAYEVFGKTVKVK